MALLGVLSGWEKDFLYGVLKLWAFLGATKFVPKLPELKDFLEDDSPQSDLEELEYEDLPDGECQQNGGEDDVD